MPAVPGEPERQDYEYKRNGTRNIFLWVEPLAGRRCVRVTDRCTSLDFANELRLLVDVDYPDAERIVLVCDNLNAHSAVALYERFEPAEANRIARRIEWHYTPEHGSWLNMAELELSVMSRQCLSRRISDEESLVNVLLHWQNQRNADQVGIDWQFTTDDARIKLKRLYPRTILN